jgi:hypothetical protein
VRLTYGVLAEGERHLLGITTNLDIDLTILAEDLVDSRSQGAIGFRLEKALDMSVRLLRDILGVILTWQRRHTTQADKRTAHPRGQHQDHWVGCDYHPEYEQRPVDYQI